MAVLKRSLSAGFLLLAVLLGESPADGAGETAPEYDVKAAFLYNFTKFVEWPSWAFHDDRSTVRLCVLGEDPFGDSLQEFAEGEVAGRRVTVLRVRSMGTPAGCQILFVSRSERERLPLILREVRDAPVLTVGDMRGFLEEGGIVNFVLDGSKVRFEISLEAAARAGIRISSRLLRLATRVVTSPRPGP